MILDSTLAKGPKLSREDQRNSTRRFMRKLNRFSVTSVIDELHKRGELTVRLAYTLFTQQPKQELADFQQWTRMTNHGAGDAFYRLNGAGAMLVYSAVTDQLAGRNFEEAASS